MYCGGCSICSRSFSTLQDAGSWYWNPPATAQNEQPAGLVAQLTGSCQPPSHKGYSRHKSLKAYFWRDAASRVFKTRRIHVACAPMAALALAWAVMDAAALENELYSTVSDKQVPEFDGKKSRLGTIPSWWKDTTGFIIDTTWYYNTWEYTYIYIYMWTLPPILKPVINEASN